MKICRGSRRWISGCRLLLSGVTRKPPTQKKRKKSEEKNGARKTMKQKKGLVTRKPSAHKGKQGKDRKRHEKKGGASHQEINRKCDDAYNGVDNSDGTMYMFLTGSPILCGRIT